MEQKSLIKFENVELELVTSESELSEVRGGKGGVLGTIIDILGDIVININCHDC